MWQVVWCGCVWWGVAGFVCIPVTRTVAAQNTRFVQYTQLIGTLDQDSLRQTYMVSIIRMNNSCSDIMIDPDLRGVYVVTWLTSPLYLCGPFTDDVLAQLNIGGEGPGCWSNV